MYNINIYSVQFPSNKKLILILELASEFHPYLCIKGTLLVIHTIKKERYFSYIYVAVGIVVLENIIKIILLSQL